MDKASWDKAWKVAVRLIESVKAGEHPTHDASQDGHSPIQVVHQQSSSFAVPVRRFVRG